MKHYEPSGLSTTIELGLRFDAVVVIEVMHVVVVVVVVVVGWRY